MKIRFIPILAVLLAPLLLFSGCGSAEARIRGLVGQIRTEWDEIMEFFEELPPVDTQGSLLPPDPPDTPSVRALKTETHIEIVESAFNSARKTVSVRTLDDPAFVSVSVSAEPADKEGYEAVPRFADLSASAVAGILSAHSLSSELFYVSNPAPSGEVVALRYAGSSDENGYYMNPDIPVTLYVSAIKPAAYQPDPSAASVVYLTFDDGPSESGTERLLDILDAYGVKAAFFTMGLSVEKYPEAARQIADRGHTFACHTYTHKYDEIYRTTAALEEEMDNWEKAASGAGIELGEHKFFRFPGGSVSNYFDEAQEAEMRAMLEERGYRIFDWNSAINDGVLYMRPNGTSALDYIRQSFGETFARSVKETGGREGEPLIVLMHENVEETVELLPWILNRLIRDGYAFGNLENFPDSWTFAERGQLLEDAGGA